MFIKNLIKRIASEQVFKSGDIKMFVESVVNGSCTEAQIGAVLYALSQQELDDEVFFALVEEIRNFAIRVDVSEENIVDSCGTGADGASTINISTSAAIVAASCGAKVIKQTNSNISSLCGSSNFLDALEIGISKTPDEVKKQFEKSGIAFVHSPYFNRFASKINPIRRQIGLKTMLNFTGPLINPVFPKNQLIGVSSSSMSEKIVTALQRFNLNRALVVCAKEPLLDELSTCGVTQVFELCSGETASYTIHPSDFGIDTAKIEDLKGGMPQENAKIISEIFQGKISKQHQTKADIIALNTGAMLYLASMANDIKHGFELAKEEIYSGKAGNKLSELKGSLIDENRLLKII